MVNRGPRSANDDGGGYQVPVPVMVVAVSQNRWQFGVMPWSCLDS